jgi:hypothetical protein
MLWRDFVFMKDEEVPRSGGKDQLVGKMDRCLAELGPQRDNLRRTG